jgi:hypothetical protein
MPHLKNVTIGTGKDAMDSQSYAALWGSTFGNGPLFYNVSSCDLNELGWSSQQWADFAQAIREQIEAVEAKPENFDKHDLRDLNKLHRWAMRCMWQINSIPVMTTERRSQG